MQVTIDIPEPLYSALQSSAREEKTSLSDLLLAKLARSASPDAPPEAGERVKLPLIRGVEPGPLMTAGVNLNHVAFMSDKDVDELLAGH